MMRHLLLQLLLVVPLVLPVVAHAEDTTTEYKNYEKPKADDKDATFQFDQPQKYNTSVSPRDGSKRFLGEDPVLNSGARKRIIKLCSKLKDKSMELFRECFEEKQEAELVRIRAAVEAGGSGALRGIPAASPDAQSTKSQY